MFVICEIRSESGISPFLNAAAIGAEKVKKFILFKQFLTCRRSQPILCFQAEHNIFVLCHFLKLTFGEDSQTCVQNASRVYKCWRPFLKSLKVQGGELGRDGRTGATRICGEGNGS